MMSRLLQLYTALCRVRNKSMEAINVHISVLHYWVEMVNGFAVEFKELAHQALKHFPDDRQLVELMVDMDMAYYEVTSYLSTRISQQEDGAIDASVAAAAAKPPLPVAVKQPRPAAVKQLSPQPRGDVKLLGVFNGSPAAWPLFRQKYIAMVHNLVIWIWIHSSSLST